VYGGVSRTTTDRGDELTVSDGHDDDDVNVENILSFFHECECSEINETNVTENVTTY